MEILSAALLIAIGICIGLTGPGAIVALVRSLDPEGFREADRIARQELNNELDER